jgi:mannose-6-phosphate isomerase
LSDAIREHPDDFLGSDVATKFGSQLPYLMKVLAAAEPLSLQVHPTSERARLGFAAEEVAGIPRAAANRRYRDPSHKPELIFALTRFEGMAGFRDVTKTAEIMRLLSLPWADDLAERLDDSQATAFQCLREIVTELLRLPSPQVRNRLASLAHASPAAERALHREDPRRRPPAVDRNSVERESRRVFAQTPQLCRRYPDDPGVLVTLLLNHVVLAAGEAMFVEAGIVHAYASGFGVEIMASSDNVVRAGLTPKHIDVDELLRITNFTPVPPPLWASSGVHVHDAEFRPPVTEFALRVARAPVDDLSAAGPRIVLVLEGSVDLQSATEHQRLRRGDAVFIRALDGPVTATGQARLAVASVPAS